MNENIFRRIEQKYLLTEKQKEALLKLIDVYIKKDDYYEREICNIYFDNDDNELIVNSLEKPIFKVKLRLRSYEVPNMDSKVFLEVKDKYKGVVGKRREKMKLSEFYDYYENNKYKDSQIMKELNYYFKLFKLKPYIFVGYDRKSYYVKNNRDLRITIDSDLRYRTDNLRLEYGSKGNNYFKDNTYIMEIKALDGLPLWLTRVLSELEIYPTSFSKVGNIYKLVRSECVC